MKERETYYAAIFMGPPRDDDREDYYLMVPEDGVLELIETLTSQDFKLTRLKKIYVTEIIEKDDGFMVTSYEAYERPLGCGNHVPLVLECRECGHPEVYNLSKQPEEVKT